MAQMNLMNCANGFAETVGMNLQYEQDAQDEENESISVIAIGSFNS
jgi:hypothetical protein